MYKIIVEQTSKENKMEFHFDRWADVTEFAASAIETSTEPVRVILWEEEEC